MKTMNSARLAVTSSVLVVALSLAPTAAHATYSIVAADTSTKQVGGAGTSCVGTLQVSAIYGVAPGFGAIHAQAYLNTQGRDEGVKLLAQGKTPAQVIAAITAAAFDSNAAARQYGVVDLSGASAGFTGSTNMAWAGDQQGTVGSLIYSVQGNILTGQAVLTQTETAFASGGGCDLAERLMLALAAGAQNGQGDTRCTKPAQIPSDAAFLRVDDASGNKLIFIEVVNTKPQSPLPALRKQFDAWRLKNPCGGGDASAKDAAGDLRGHDGAPDATTSPDAATPDAGIVGEGDEGCGCQVARPSALGLAFAALLLLVLFRRL
jgi:uncharacterized Ntn-hydrolase superfamily protein